MLTVVWRVGEDEIELFVAFLDVFEYICTHRETFVGLDLTHDLGDEGQVLRVLLDGNDTVASSGNQLDADATCAGKQVEGCDTILEINVIVAKDIEQVFLGKVCGRTCLECMGDVESASFVNTANYSHIIKVCRSNGRWLGWGRSVTCRKNLLSSVNSSS